MPLLDTDIVIDIQRGHAPACAWFRSLSELPALPGYVAMELIQDARTAKELSATRKFIKPLPVVWPSEAECNLALANFTSWHLSQGLGLLDALIAACAVGRGEPLCTFNVKHYRVVPGLTTLQPYTR